MLPSTSAPAAPPPEGPWYAEPLAPVRTEVEALALASMLRDWLASLQLFPHLQSLHLVKTQVTDPGLSALERLPRLSSLDLGGTRLDNCRGCASSTCVRGTGVSAETQTLLEREHGVRLKR